MNKEKENKNAEISARIAGILDYFSESKNAFALKLGYERAQTVYDIINGKNAPSYDFFKKFQFSEYSEIINTDWLLTGRGSMLKTKCIEQIQSAENVVVTEDKNKASIIQTKHSVKSEETALMSDKDTGKEKVSAEVNYEYKGAPYYNVDFIGGFDLVLNDQTRNPDYYIDFAPYNKEGVIWCNITGHSMEPELNNGDFIAMKEMHDPIQYLPYGEIYGIVTDSYRTVKRIRMADRDGFVRLIPTNKSSEYGEQEIPIKMIRKVYAVLGSMHRLF